MFGLFGRFGRSQELRRLDDALRGAGVHPALVPDAVELTIVRQLKAAHGAGAAQMAEAADLIAWCVMGPENFVAANGAVAADDVARRLEVAIAAGDSLDARLVLLVLHARLIRPEIVARYGLEIDG